MNKIMVEIEAEAGDMERFKDHLTSVQFTKGNSKVFVPARRVMGTCATCEYSNKKTFYCSNLNNYMTAGSHCSDWGQ